MSSINQLSTISSLSSGDLFVVYNGANGDTRKCSLNTLLTYFEDTFTAPDFDEIVNVPINGFNVSFTDSSANQWLILRPAGTLATGTITLPVSTGLVDGQELIVNTTQEVTALTVAGNGATVNGAPTTLTANATFKLRYNLTTTEWYRIAD